MAIAASGQRCELREVVLRDKPAELIAASAKATVPVLVDVDGRVIDQSLDIMRWALERNDPEGWLRPERGALDDMLALVADCDLGFKPHLDGYKYPGRQAGADGLAHRREASIFLAQLDNMLLESRCLCGERIALADIAIAPFVRQFAQVDAAWFDPQPWDRLKVWLAAFNGSLRFCSGVGFSWICVGVEMICPGSVMPPGPLVRSLSFFFCSSLSVSLSVSSTFFWNAPRSFR